MFLRCTGRKKDGKLHRHWSLVESRRVSGGRVTQRPLLYLGEINDSQRAAWRKTIEVFQEGSPCAQTPALFPEDSPAPVDDATVVRLRLGDVRVERPRQWGACWLASHLYAQLGLDEFWAERLPPSRKGTRWDLILQALTADRLIDPGSEWRLHREWYVKSAMADLLGSGYELAEIHKLYACLDRLLPHKRELFEHLTRRWTDLFNASYEVLLYDLTSTYFESDPPVQYLVGTPKGRLTALEAALMDKPWRAVREGMKVKVLPYEGELYVLAESRGRIAKERAMRRRQLKRLWNRLGHLARMQGLDRDRLMRKLGAAEKQWPAGWRLVRVEVGADRQLHLEINREILRQVRRREGRYLLRTNLTEEDPAKLWELYMRLVQVEEAFRTLKGDLALRPIYHQKEQRIEAHIFVAFLAYALHVTLRHRLRDLAPGLTSRAVIEKLRAMPMVDVHLPTTDGREVILSRYTQPDPEIALILRQRKLHLPPQPPPRSVESAKSG